MVYSPAVSDFADIPINNVNNQQAPIYNASKSDFSDIPFNQPNQVTSTVQPQNLLNRVANSAPVNFVLGAGDAINNNAINVANLLPGVNIPQVKNANGLSYNLGQGAGNVGAFLAGGEGLDAIRGASEAIPYAGQLASALGGTGTDAADFASGVARRAIGSAAYGATQDPQNRLQGAATGAALSGLLDVAPGSFYAGRTLASYAQPQAYANALMNSMGGGQTIEQVGQSLAQDVNNAKNIAEKNNSALFSPVNNTVGGNGLYNQTINPTGNVIYYHVSNPKSSSNVVNNGLQSVSYKPDFPLITNDKNAAIQYNNSVNGKNAQGNLLQISMPPSAANSYVHPAYTGDVNTGFNPDNDPNVNLYGIKRGIPSKYISQVPNVDPNSNYGQVLPLTKQLLPDTQKLANNFNANPIFSNAHLLQSQIGTDIRSLADAPKSPNNMATIQNYSTVQKAVQDDMNSYLKNYDAQNGVDPANDPEGQSMFNQYQNAKNDFLQNVVPYRENPKIAQIANEAVTNPRNVPNIFRNPEDDIQKVVQDIGPSANNKILYSQLASDKNLNNSDSLINGINSLNDKGVSLGSYVTPQLQNQFDTLQSRTNVRNGLQGGVGLLSTLGIADKLPVPDEVKLAAAYGGAKYANKLMSGVPSWTGAPFKAVGKSYYPLANVAKANALTNINNIK